MSSTLSSNQESLRSSAWQEYRLLVLAVLIGLLGGLSAQVFVWLLGLAEHLLLVGIAGYIAPEAGATALAPRLGSYGLWLVPVVTALGGLVSGIIVYTFAPEAEGHGTDAAIHSYHHNSGKVRRIVPLVKAIASAITIGSGGAAGREGPAAQISVGASSIVADLLNLEDDDRRILVLAGMAAGLSAIFRSPLGMAIFAVEILYSGMVFETGALIYTVVAAVVAYAVNGLFVGWSPIFHFSQTLHFTAPLDLVGYTVLGIVAGVVGGIEPTIFYGIRDCFKRLKVPNHIKPAIGGLLMGLLALVVPQTISTGYGWVQGAISGEYVGWSLILLAFAKILAMSLTISSGGSGGVFGPNVYIGAMIGAWTAFALDHILAVHLSTAAFAVVGMAAVFAGTARVPIATLVMVAEMTGGYGLIVPTMLATSIAFVVQRTIGAQFRYPRLYEAQVELLKDSPTHHKNFLQAAFEILKKGTLVDTSELSFPQLADLLRLGKTILVHNGQVELFAAEIAIRSKLAGRSVAEAFGDFPNLILVAVIRDNQVSVPRGATVLCGGDRLLIAADADAKVDWATYMAQA